MFEKARVYIQTFHECVKAVWKDVFAQLSQVVTSSTERQTDASAMASAQWVKAALIGGKGNW